MHAPEVDDLDYIKSSLPSQEIFEFEKTEHKL